MFARPRAKEERKKEKKKRNGGEGERGVFGQGEEERVVLCENEEGMRGLYRSGGRFRVRPLWLGLGGKRI